MISAGPLAVWFETTSGNRYAYDDNTGTVFPVPSSWAEGMPAKHEDQPFVDPPFLVFGNEVRNNAELWWRMISQHNAFADTDSRVRSAPELSPAGVRDHVTSEGFRQLILNVTWDCNLRCKYCCYSDEYPYSRGYGADYITFATARKAIDYYLFHLERTRIRYPQRRAVITFYGGEPLLNVDLIIEVIQYIRALGEGNALFTITTNGTLLTSDAADLLVKHNVAVFISLDGPQSEHDRLRVYSDGRGSFQTVYENCLELMGRHFGYTGAALTACYDCDTNFVDVVDFFSSHESLLPPVAFALPVVSSHTHYYDRFSCSQRQLFSARIDNMRGRYLRSRSSTPSTRVCSYLEALVGAPAMHVLLRNRAGNRRPPGLPFTGACFPGDKMCVYPTGQIHMCERINPHFPIGHVDTGLDFDAILEIIRAHTEFMKTRCCACPITKMCPVCFQTVAADGVFSADPAELCNMYQLRTAAQLRYVWSILEHNPEAFRCFPVTSPLNCGTI